MDSYTRIIASGAALPESIMTNDDLSKIIDTSHEWIVQRTGIEQRHIAAPHETTSLFGKRAAVKALESADIDPQTIDLIIVATSTPDKTFPATATLIQGELGISGGAAFDVQAVCSGFIFALSTADAMLKAGHGKRALVIGAETFSRLLDWEDRGTCVLFGDGAGAVVLERFESEGKPERGLYRTIIRSDGRLHDRLYVDGGPGSDGRVGHLRMLGSDVFKLAVGMVPEIIHDILKAESLTPEDVDWFVPHQANLRIIDATAKKFGWPDEKVVRTVMNHANTSAASIPLALASYHQAGHFKPGDLLLLEAMGGGFTWAAGLLRW